MDTLTTSITVTAVLAIALVIQLAREKRRMNRKPKYTQLRDPEAWQANVDTKWQG